jgi:hypothetical protein
MTGGMGHQKIRICFQAQFCREEKEGVGSFFLMRMIVSALLSGKII